MMKIIITYKRNETISLYNVRLNLSLQTQSNEVLKTAIKTNQMPELRRLETDRTKGRNSNIIDNIFINLSFKRDDMFMLSIHYLLLIIEK